MIYYTKDSDGQKQVFTELPDKHETDGDVWTDDDVWFEMSMHEVKSIEEVVLEACPIIPAGTCKRYKIILEEIP